MFLKFGPLFWAFFLVDQNWDIFFWNKLASFISETHHVSLKLFLLNSIVLVGPTDRTIQRFSFEEINLPGCAAIPPWKAVTFQSHLNYLQALGWTKKMENHQRNCGYMYINIYIYMYINILIHTYCTFGALQKMTPTKLDSFPKVTKLHRPAAKKDWSWISWVIDSDRMPCCEPFSGVLFVGSPVLGGWRWDALRSQ